MAARQPIDADQAVQHVLNAWGVLRTSTASRPMSSDFKALFEKMQAYRTAKSIADNRRKFEKITEGMIALEQRTKEEFLEAYQTFYPARV